jgi:glycosyltransferase involved in cell wall biosynthesis
LFAIDEMSGGGSQRQMIGILRKLDRTRFEPQLYLVSPVGELLEEVPADVPVHVFGKRHRLPRWTYPGQGFLARIRDLADVLREQQIDLIYDRTYHMTLVASPATKRRPTPRIPVIVTDPKLDFETNVEWLRSLKRFLLKRAYQTADRVVAVSEGVRKAAVERYGLAPDKTLTLYNFFDIERIDCLMAEPLPPEETRPNGEWVEIVAAGRLHPQKGFLFLLEAVRDLVQNRGQRQIRLRILGTGPQQRELSDYVAEHGLAPHVSLAGFQANPLPYFRQADLFCLSSLYEGMPNALVEAVLCGVPVLATDCPSGPAEILDGGRLGRLVPPADARALADAIEDAIIHRDGWQSLVGPARSHIEHEFSAAAGIQRLEELFSSLVRR